MLARLLETDYLTHRENTTESQILLWLNELRSPQFLVEAAGLFAEEAERSAADRPLLRDAISGDEEALRRGLLLEELAERDADRGYWAPLRAELERCEGPNVAVKLNLLSRALLLASSFLRPQRTTARRRS